MKLAAPALGVSRLIAASVLVLSSAYPTWAASLYVTPDGSGDYPTIRQAMTAAVDGDTILLGDGTFLGEDNHNIDFLGKAVSVCSQSRNPDLCIIDCTTEESDPEVAHRGFYFGHQEGPRSRVEGLRLVNGRALAACPGCRGGAILCTDDSSPTIVHCVFENNVASEGGAVACDDSSNASLQACVFLNNQALEWSGGALSCIVASPVLQDCSFENNQANETGGAIYCYSLSSPTITASLMTGGVAIQGGAIYCAQASHAVLTDCILRNNSAIAMGGGVYCVDSSPVLEGCTLHANAAYVGGGLACRFGSHPTVANTIISFGTQGEAIYCDVPTFVPSLECCDLYGNSGGDWTGHIGSQLGEDGNVCLDPLYCLVQDPEQPLTLRGSSPCAPEQNPERGLIGACPVGCEWSAEVEQPFRDLEPGSIRAGCTPNPFTGDVIIHLGLRGGGSHAPGVLAIYDIAGRIVTKLPTGPMPDGAVVAHWDGIDRNGVSVPPGVYLLRLCPGARVGREAKALTLIRVE
jgi:predicted outer membrane repeat protein